MVIFWGTFFPLISEFFTGEKHSLAAPWFDRYVTPIGVLLVLFTGIGPLLAWGRLSGGRRAAPAALAGHRGRGDDRRRCSRSATPAAIPGRSSSSRFAAFTLVALLGEFWRAGSTRHALTGEALSARARARAVGRNRRRYGGYIVHAGIALTLVGIAASSSFQTNRDLRLQVGQSAKVGDYTIAYRKLTADPPERADRLRRPARRHARRQARRHPQPGAQLLPDRRIRRAGAIGRYFMGESTSEVGLRTGAGGDLWTAFQPDLSLAQPRDRPRQPRARRACRPQAQGIAILALVQHYIDDAAPPANFRVIVNPLVGWIWIGALIALAGAVMAGWPALESRRRLEAAYRARLGKELGTREQPLLVR